VKTVRHDKHAVSTLTLYASKKVTCVPPGGPSVHFSNTDFFWA